jgi:nitroimidazol reductase NimA-like FMN-containing flavoprotein (pyridoxamine 5'-phosphate oxidase superfamily)
MSATWGEPTPIIELDEAECWRLLSTHPLGRLAVTATDGDVDVFPLDFLAHERCLYLRSAPGSKLRDITAHRAVALESDGEDVAGRWSVVVRGRAERLALDTEIIESGVLALRSTNPTAKYNYVRVTPTTITGRRFATA